MFGIDDDDEFDEAYDVIEDKEVDVSPNDCDNCCNCEPVEVELGWFLLCCCWANEDDEPEELNECWVGGRRGGVREAEEEEADKGCWSWGLKGGELLTGRDGFDGSASPRGEADGGEADGILSSEE